MKIKRKKFKIRSRKRKIGMAPFNGYSQLAKEEVKSLQRMTMREAIIQTEILLRATRWMK